MSRGTSTRIDRKSVQGPDDGNEFALNLDIVCAGVDRLHGYIRGLKPNAGTFEVDLFERRLFLLSQPDRDRFAVLAGLLPAKQHDVAIVDQGVNHRVSLDPEREEIAAVVWNKIAAQFDHLGLA